MVYAIIEKTNGKCVNRILWDGVAPWAPPQGAEIEQMAEAFVGDDCEKKSGKWKTKLKLVIETQP